MPDDIKNDNLFYFLYYTRFIHTYTYIIIAKRKMDFKPKFVNYTRVGDMKFYVSNEQSKKDVLNALKIADSRMRNIVKYLMQSRLKYMEENLVHDDGFAFHALKSYMKRLEYEITQVGDMNTYYLFQQLDIELARGKGKYKNIPKWKQDFSDLPE